MSNQKGATDQVVDYTFQLFRQMQADIYALKKTRETVSQAKLSMQTYGLAQAEYAYLPTGSKGAMIFVTNGRKPSETAGNGTGVHAFYNDASSTWLSLYDNLAVTI